jgi:GDP-mannose transporter
VTSITLISFGLMVFSSLVAAYSDIAQAMVSNNLSMPHTPDSLSGGTIDPSTHLKSPAYDPLGEEKANILAMTQGVQDQVLDGAGGYAILSSGYVWMALNCAFSAAYVLAMRKRIKVTGFKDWDTMFYNNLLTIPVLIVMSLVCPFGCILGWKECLLMCLISTLCQLAFSWSKTGVKKTFRAICELSKSVWYRVLRH